METVHPSRVVASCDKFNQVGTNANGAILNPATFVIYVTVQSSCI